MTLTGERAHATWYEPVPPSSGSLRPSQLLCGGQTQPGPVAANCGEPEIRPWNEKVRAEMARKQASDFDQGLLDLFDRYVHGLINRREFLDGAASFTVGGVSTTALLESLSPRYAERQQVRSDDAQVSGDYVEYSSPRGAGTMRGYLVRPAGSNGDLPGVVVVHENRGLNPHIEDVARRTAVAGFLAFAPDALAPLGGYPGNDDDGRTLQGQRDRGEMQEDFVAAGGFLKSHEECSGTVGVVGFCYGGGSAT